MSTQPKALIVVTSHAQLGDTGQLTGSYLPEVTHPYAALVTHGIQVDIASIAGGRAPIDPSSLDSSDARNQSFLETPESRTKFEQTPALASIDPRQYQAVIFAGGHGTMWDFRDSADAQRVAAAIYEQGGVVAAVCHGAAALVDVRLRSGRYLLQGRKVTAFSNSEEEAIGLHKVVPFSMESALVQRGADYSKAELWQAHVQIDGRLVTGQNPASAAGVGEAVAELLVPGRD